MRSSRQTKLIGDGDFSWTVTSGGHFFSKWAKRIHPKYVHENSNKKINSRGQNVHKNSPILSTKIHLLCPREVCNQVKSCQLTKQNINTLSMQSLLQVNLCRKLLFLHQLTHNMTTDCSLFMKIVSSEYLQNMLCTQIVAFVLF